MPAASPSAFTTSGCSNLFRIERASFSGCTDQCFAVGMPIFNALIGVLVARTLGLGPGNALLFVVLCASASYLAVPTAMRMTVPEAKSNYYISTTLGLTFPFNIIIGIPVYMGLVNKFIPLPS